MVLIQKSIRLRLYPTIAQSSALRRVGGATRWCWNHLLAENQARYAETKTFSFYKEMSASLPGLKAEHPWLVDAPATSLQRIARNLDTALRACFKHGRGFPRFKAKSLERDAFYLTNQQVKFDDLRISILKVGEVRFRTGAAPHGRVLNATVTQDGAMWWCSVLCEVEVEQGECDIENAIGIDLGLLEFITTSEGEVVGNPRFGRKAANKLARAQRRMARRQKGGKNRLKARRAVQACHRAMRDQRASFLHRISRDLVDTYDYIFTEDLNISGMARTRLARSIADAAWGELLRQITYKAIWAGKNHTRIDRFAPSSQLCSACGSRQRLALSQRTYACPCGLELDRDLNAAINIRDIGLRQVGACRAEFTPVEIPLMEIGDSFQISHVSLK
jgi:putative transposase